MLTSSPAGKLNVHAASADDQFALTQDLIQTLSYQPARAPAISPPASGGEIITTNSRYNW